MFLCQRRRVIRLLFVYPDQYPVSGIYPISACHADIVLCSLVPRPSPSSAPCALRVIIKCGGGKTEPGRIYHVIRGTGVRASQGPLQNGYDACCVLDIYISC